MSRYSLDECIEDAWRAMGRVDVLATGNIVLPVHMTGKIFLQLSNWKKDSLLLLDKVISEYYSGNLDEIIILATNRSETKGYQKLTDRPDLIMCLIAGRMNLNEGKSGAPFPSVVFHIGKGHRKFIEVFASRGDYFKVMESPA